MGKLEQALENCLTMLANSQATLEDCLASYPEHADELRRLLTTVGYLEQSRAVQPSPMFKARTRAKLIAYASTHPPGRMAGRWAHTLLLQLGLVFGRAFNLALSIAAILLLFLMTGTVLAQMALPGDGLYGWRLASERVWRTLHPNPVTANITLAERHARDLTRVAGDPQAEQRALQDYQQLLAELERNNSPISQETISQSLIEQKASLDEADLDVPELDQLLAVVDRQEAELWLENKVVAVDAGRVTYSLTITNHGPTSPVTATIINVFSPTQTLVSASEPGCAASSEGVLTCTVTNVSTTTPHKLTLTTAIPLCYSGVVTNTATVTGTDNIINTNPDNQAVVEQPITLPFPGSAWIVYVQSNDQRHDLVGTVTSTAPPLTANLQAHAAAPAWSPDGGKLAFFGEEGISELGGVYEQGNGVWVMDIVNGQGQNPRLIVAQAHVKNMVWSSDGTKLAFEVGPPDRTHEIMVVDPRDGHQISRYSGQQPAWSPDSQKIVFKGCVDGCGLWQVNFDGSGAEQLTFGDSDSYPAWSPTGQFLVFTSARDGNWDLCRLQRADDQLVRLTDRPGTDITPVFGPCGQNIYVRTDHYGGWRITVMRLDGSDETTIVEGVGATEEWGLARPAIYQP
jgi:Tol biopolymer transport system component